MGYRVLVSPTTAVSLGDVGQEVFCWIHHHQREDAVTLYGFATKDERSSFEALLGAHGVGPALALASCPSTRRSPWPASWPRTTSARCASCRASGRRRPSGS